jgi:hypothetical protein
VDVAAGMVSPELIRGSAVVDPPGTRFRYSSPGYITVARGQRDGAPITEWDLAVLPGTGDIWSTVGDLTRFAWLLDRDVLSRMWVPQVALPSPSDGLTHYGYGMYVGPDLAPHPGDNPGFRSVLVWQRSGGFAAVLSNDETAPDPWTVLHSIG